MKASEVLYYNAFTGKTEYCDQRDVVVGRTLNARCSQQYVSEIVKKILLNDTYSMTEYAKNLISIEDLWNGNFINDRKEHKHRETVFEVIEKDESNIIIQMKIRTAFMNNGPYSEYCYSKIQFKRQKHMQINGLECNGLIKIYDFLHENETADDSEILGQFALFVGLYLFVDLDGDWLQYDNLGNFVDKKTDVQTKVIKDSIDEIKKTVNDNTDRIISSHDVIANNQNAILGKVDSVIENTDKLSDKIDELSVNVNIIKENIDNISLAINLYKDDLEAKLDKIVDDIGDRENLINDFCDRVCDRIIDKIGNENIYRQSDKDAYLEAEEDLQQQFGKVWLSLDNESIQLLVTAKMLFNDLEKNEQKDRPFDFSGICILLSKAVEIEMKKRFYYDFIGFLSRNYPNKLEEWHYVLTEKRRIANSDYLAPLDDKRFTLGSIMFVCCVKNNRKVPERIRTISEQRLIEFASSELFLEKDKNKVLNALNQIGKKIDYIRSKYRNPSAHTGVMNKSDAQSCFDELIYVTKSFIYIMEMFKK